MKSKYKSFKKQGIKIFTRTISIMFLFGIIVYGVYAYITLNNEKQIQQTHSNEMFLEFLDEVNTCYNTYNSLQHTIQSNSDNNTKIKYYEKSLVFKRHKEPTYESSNCLPFTFANETGVSTENYTGIIEYESFRNSISDEDYQEIYEYYYVGENSVRNNGNGLGLSIVKNIMQAHNFDFGAELENDKIVFYFTF